MNAFWEGVVTIVLAIIGLAIIAVIISKKANTAGVLQAAASGLGNDLAVAAAPVTGVPFSLNLGYPSETSQNYGFGN